jgi:formimidoylglutamate deiminase
VSFAGVVEADLTWTGERLEPGLRILINHQGRIEAVGPLAQSPDLRLRDRALLPGFVNAHSHAFQWGLRGQGERFAGGAGSFWSWREAMYRLSERLDPEEFFRLCLGAYREMRRGGITSVGEFHYLHHSPETTDWSYDRLVLRAARAADIRLVLLNAYYRSGGIGRPLEGAQRRFDGGSLAVYWEQQDRIAAELDPLTQTLGAVAHSVRAVAPEEIASLHAEAARRGLVFHLHLEEQRQEIEDSVAAYGRRPMALLNQLLPSTRQVTAVHCTHTDPADLDCFLERGGTVCVCPLTEANLGDGIPALAGVRSPGDRLCLGTDSNARIAMAEEMRWLEYGQRLRREERGALRDPEGQVARVLLRAATEAGAASLGVKAGRIEPGRWADFCAVDLTAPELASADRALLLEAFVFGAGSAVVRETCVGGRWSGSER